MRRKKSTNEWAVYINFRGKPLRDEENKRKVPYYPMGTIYLDGQLTKEEANYERQQIKSKLDGRG